MRIADLLPIVPIDMDEDTRNFLGSLEDRIDEIDAVRVEEDNLYVLGSKGFRDLYYEIVQNRISGEVSETSFRDHRSFGTTMAKLFTLSLWSLTPGVRQRKKQTKEYEQKVERYREANLNDAEKKIEGIKVYQGPIDEVERILGRPLETVDTGKHETFLRAPNTFRLRVLTYQLGGNTVVNYQPGSCIGTPVRYSDKKV